MDLRPRRNYNESQLKNQQETELQMLHWTKVGREDIIRLYKSILTPSAYQLGSGYQDRGYKAIIR